jgi:hypothetical protein
MPHDINGKLLEVGDVVMVPVKILTISPGTDYCNISVETVEKMYPGEYKTTFTLNGKQVVKQDQ